MPPKPIYALDKKRFGPLIAEQYNQSEASKFGISKEAFAGILAVVAGKYLTADSSERDASSFIAALRVQELVLARACSAGNEGAWEVFLTRFREPLYNAG